MWRLFQSNIGTAAKREEVIKCKRHIWTEPLTRGWNVRNDWSLRRPTLFDLIDSLGSQSEGFLKYISIDSLPWYKNFTVTTLEISHLLSWQSGDLITHMLAQTSELSIANLSRFRNGHLTGHLVVSTGSQCATCQRVSKFRLCYGIDGCG